MPNMQSLFAGWRYSKFNKTFNQNRTPYPNNKLNYTAYGEAET